MNPLSLVLLPGVFTAFRLAAGARPPEPATLGPLAFLSVTPAEVSIIAPMALALSERHLGPLRILRLEGVFDTSVTGVLAALAAPLAAAGCFLLAQGTFDTDYLLVREDQMALALAAWRGAGISVRSE